MLRRVLLQLFGIGAVVAPASTALAAMSPEEAPVTPIEGPRPVTLCTDFWAMVKDIRAHVKRTGEQVLPFDDPTKLLVGFSTDTMEWHMPIVRLKNTCPRSLHAAWLNPSRRGRIAQVLSRPGHPLVMERDVNLLPTGMLQLLEPHEYPYDRLPKPAAPPSSDESDLLLEDSEPTWYPLD